MTVDMKASMHEFAAAIEKLVQWARPDVMTFRHQDADKAAVAVNKLSKLFFQHHMFLHKLEHWLLTPDHVPVSVDRVQHMLHEHMKQFDDTLSYSRSFVEVKVTVPDNLPPGAHTGTLVVNAAGRLQFKPSN